MIQMGAWPDWVAAVAAVCAAILVGWQSWETRKSAQASAKAVIAANLAVSLSQEVLEVARIEERHTRKLIGESVKSRIDAGTQWLKVTASHSVRWPPHDADIIIVTGGSDNFGEPPDLRLDVVYRLPKDRNHLIGVRVAFSIFNDSPRTVVVAAGEYWTEIVPGQGPLIQNPGPKEIPGETAVKGYFHVARPVSEWVEIAGHRAAGHTGDQAKFTFTVSDDSDAGAIDQYDILVSGTPLVQVSDEEGAWRLQPGQYQDYHQRFPVVAAVALPGKRTYYLSKSKNLLLDTAFGEDLSHT
ncbi:hypothetical protein EV652_10377 [Kribbella steppae]|uniref:Uncharacterized protein n=1 Tax=Kribbella steppae TaxID=2512223 RepID=A0A4R2HRG7_9ACTN|nr:hypothetical protein [Kribbella steppae]TCO33078.1 hypothetical protein EV652_10377 [Kribbella steppae]